MERNITAFRWGRHWAVNPDEVEQAAGYVARNQSSKRSTKFVDRLAADRTDYQSAAYARKYRDIVATARAVEHAVDPSGGQAIEAPRHGCSQCS